MVDTCLMVLEFEQNPMAGLDREYSVYVEHTELEVISGGEQGPAGRPGAPGPAGGSALQRTAGELLSALRVVYEEAGQVFYLGASDGTHIDALLGLTLTAATPGAVVNVQRSGAIDDAGWNWSPGRIWLGAAGALTQTPPVDGFDVLIGTAVSATRVLLNIQDPLELE